MPILKPGQVIDGQDKAPELYGVKPQTNSMMFQERLLKLFQPQQFVNMKNIDDETLYWQCVPETSETVTYTQGGSMKDTHRLPPEQWYLMPGDTEPIPGYAALVGFDALYKKVAAKSTLKQYKDPSNPQYSKDGSYTPRNFNFSDANVQEATINEAFKGIAVPTFGGTPAPSVEQPASQPESDGRKWPTPTETTEYATPDKPAKASVHAGSAK